ncbi:MAG: 4Fe-4S dicluster domain-containing protein [Planctomycetes bacterium]|nr:4Fe-4S dicluster domain-containing protein [Planctomycetota bacterium]
MEAVKKTRPLVKVPLMVKLPPFLPNLDQVLKELVTAGVDAIAAMDSIGPVMTIDIETGRPHMGSPDGSGYLSGKYILPVTLKYIYEITRFVNLPVVGVGGVTDYRGALQMIMAGATGVGMVSAPMLRGFEIFNQTAAALRAYLEKRGCKAISELKGLTHKRAADRQPLFGVKAGIDPDLCNSCGLCLRVCYALAIEEEEKTYRVLIERCVSCGLCESVCPVEAVFFS